MCPVQSQRTCSARQPPVYPQSTSVLPVLPVRPARRVHVVIPARPACVPATLTAHAVCTLQYLTTLLLTDFASSLKKTFFLIPFYSCTYQLLGVYELQASVKDCFVRCMFSDFSCSLIFCLIY
jgi:hypothetical protein